MKNTRNINELTFKEFLAGAKGFTRLMMMMQAKLLLEIIKKFDLAENGLEAQVEIRKNDLIIIELLHLPTGLKKEFIINDFTSFEDCGRWLAIRAKAFKNKCETPFRFGV